MKIEGSVPFCLKASRRKFPNKPTPSLMIQIIQREKMRAVDLGSLPQFEEQLGKFMEQIDGENDQRSEEQPDLQIVCALHFCFSLLEHSELNDLLP